MTNLKVADQYAARILMLSFFLPAKWQVAVVMSVSSWFIIRSLNSIRDTSKNDFAWALFFSSLFVLYFASLAMTPVEYRKILLHLCERKVSLFFTPFVIALAGPYYRKVILGELHFFVFGCLISCVAGNLDFIGHYYFSGGGLHEASHVAYRIMFEHTTGIHPTYMGMFLGLSICITMLSGWYNFRNGTMTRYALVFLMLVFLLALLAKSAIVAMILIFVHFGWTKRKWVYMHKVQIGAMVIALSAACYFIPFTGQRIKEVFSFMGHNRPAGITDNSVYVRKMILETDLTLLKHNWLTGVGPGRVLHSLQERFFFFSLDHNTDVSHYDPHNEYLNEWLGFGLAGILLLISILVIHLYRSIHDRNQLYIYFLIILVTTFFTETVLARQEGVIFYALFTSLFFFSSSRKNSH